MRPQPLVVLFLSLVGQLGAQHTPQRWRLSERPILVLGTRDGRGPDAFGKVAGAARLRSGAVTVVDGMSLEVRTFSSTGEPLRTAGRQGAGPGEFRTVKSVRHCAGDSTFVYDPALVRISVFDPGGSYTRALDVRSWSPEGLPPYDFWCNTTGTLLFIHRSSAPPAGLGPRRPDVAITLVDRDGSVVNLGTFPASERYFSGSEDFPRPLGKETAVALGPAAVYLGTGDAFEIAQYSLRGTRRGTLRDHRDPVSVTTAHVNAFIEDQLARRAGRANTRALETLYREIEYPKTFPAHGALLVDPGDDVWVESYPIPGDKVHDWLIYSKAGVAVATMQVPSAFAVLEVGADYVLGVWRDESGVEYVTVYSLVK